MPPKAILTVSENNNLIVKAFATAWRYREMYERYGDTDKIIAMEHTSPRQFYRHLDLAYMNPETINHIVSGKHKVNVNDLFQIAKSDLFKQGPNKQTVKSPKSEPPGHVRDISLPNEMI